uniref:Uncharacterized protein n=1 Tax=Monodon monoceros TaxID=40151 RepID=A0A8C6CD31_MONMO
MYFGESFLPLTFKVIINRYVLIAILLLVFSLFFVFLPCSLLFWFLPCGLMILFSGILVFLSLHFLCIHCRSLICVFLQGDIDIFSKNRLQQKHSLGSVKIIIF